MEEKITKVITFLNMLWKKGKGRLSHFLVSADDFLNRLDQMIMKKSEEINRYIEDRSKLVHEFNEKQEELEFLRKKIRQTEAGEVEKVRHLYKELEKRSEELAHIHQSYLSLEAKKEAYANEIDKVTIEKENILNDRNYLKAEYNHLKIIHKHNLAKLEQLYTERDQLTSTSSAEHSTTEEVQEKQILIDQLEQENAINNRKIEEKEQLLLEKSREVSRLTSESEKLQQKIEESNKEYHALNVRYIVISDKLTEQEQAYQNQAAESRHNLEYYNALVAEKEEVIAHKQEQIDIYDEEIIKENERYQIEIDALRKESEAYKEELLEEQGASKRLEKISNKTRKILEKEYESRFEALYLHCIFKREFLDDFFELNAAERLKVESNIAQINQEGEKLMSKVRPNSVKGKTKTLLEYPFKKDSPGRLYLKKEYERIIFYRISRGKNKNNRLSQHKVIEWIQRNV